MALAASVAEAIAEDGLEVVGNRAIKALALRRKLGPYVIEPFGLEELVDVSYQALPDAVKRAFVNA